MPSKPKAYKECNATKRKFRITVEPLPEESEQVKKKNGTKNVRKTKRS